LSFGIPESVQNSEERNYMPFGAAPVDANMSAPLGSQASRMMEQGFLSVLFKEEFHAQRLLPEWEEEFSVRGVYLHP
jgi:hypothetical protein